jgi:hypothetical protein
MGGGSHSRETGFPVTCLDQALLLAEVTEIATFSGQALRRGYFAERTRSFASFERRHGFSKISS